MATNTADWFASAPDFSSVWPALISGRARIVCSGTTDAQHYIQLAASPVSPAGSKLSAHRIKMFERVLLGEPLKVVASDMGYSISTVATAVGSCLRAMGIPGRSVRIPALLVLALHALRGQSSCACVRVERVFGTSQDVQLSSDRLERPLRNKLTASELAVVALIIEGNSHAEIAMRRRTSARTVANQIASVYRKLRVSSRLELLRYLVIELEADALRAFRGAEGTPVN